LRPDEQSKRPLSVGPTSLRVSEDHIERAEGAVASSSRERSPARRLVAGFADERHVDDSVALLVASELVTNAVMHGTEPVTPAADWDGVCLYLHVADGSPDLAAVKAQSPESEQFGGRGLMLIEALCRRWGVARHPDGKKVWAELEPGPAIR
jgi:anti-sigma regulatory factor (Ser/Thr protein kinase)